MKKEEQKTSKWNISLHQRWKIPWLDLFIVEGSAIRRDVEEFKALEERFETLERQYRRKLISNEIRARQLGNMQHRLNVIMGRIKAPECPKCGKPKTPGGIHWLDHAECYAGKSKSQKAKRI